MSGRAIPSQGRRIDFSTVASVPVDICRTFHAATRSAPQVRVGGVQEMSNLLARGRFTEGVAKIAGRQSRYAIGQGLSLSASCLSPNAESKHSGIMGTVLRQRRSAQATVP